MALTVYMSNAHWCGCWFAILVSTILESTFFPNTMKCSHCESPSLRCLERQDKTKKAYIVNIFLRLTKSAFVLNDGFQMRKLITNLSKARKIA